MKHIITVVVEHFTQYEVDTELRKDAETLALAAHKAAAALRAIQSIRVPTQPPAVLLVARGYRDARLDHEEVIEP